MKIYKNAGKLFGKIIEIFPDEGTPKDPKCDKCPDGDIRKGKSIKGMNIIQNLSLKAGKWVGDDGILDPNNGKLYDCKIWLDENDSKKLNVRGYIGFFFRTQTWIRK